MAYGITTRVPAPVAMYDAVHAALLARTETDCGRSAATYRPSHRGRL